MKKNYFLLLFLFTTVSLYAQLNDTLYSHMDGSSLEYFAFEDGEGFLSGSNSYGEKEAVQLFDAKYGVAGPGTVNGVLFLIGKKTGNFSTVGVNLYADDNGKPGSLLANPTVNVSSVSTNEADFTDLSGATSYNVNVAFNNPILIPSSGKFWVGIVYPTGIARGDTLVIMTSDENEFDDANTHAGVIAADGTFESYVVSAEAKIANAIFPYVTFNTSVGLNEETPIFNVEVYPNPANAILHFDLKEIAVDQINIVDISGKLINTIVVNSPIKTIDLAEYENGTYFFQMSNKGTAVGTEKVTVLK